MKTILNIDNKPFESRQEAESTINALKHIDHNGEYEISKLKAGYVIINTSPNTTGQKNNDLESARDKDSHNQPESTSPIEIDLKLKPSLLDEPHKLVLSAVLLSAGVYLKTSFDINSTEQYLHLVVSEAPLVMMLLSPLPILGKLYNKLSTTYYINKDEIRIRKGIIGRSGDSIMPEDVRKIELDQTFIQRIVNVGNVALSSSGTESEKIIFKGIRRPVEVRVQINELSKQLKLRKSIQ